MEFINLVQGSMIVAQYEAKFTSLSRFTRAFVSTEEEKAKQFMRRLKPSIRNKIAGNLIKVYSTMVNAAMAIEETLNETRKITNPKSQCEGTSNQFEGHFSKKSKNSTSHQQHPARSSPITLVASSGQTSRGRPICFVHVEEEQLGSYRIAATYSVSPGLEGYSSITSAQTSYQFRPQAVDTGASHSFTASFFTLTLGLEVEVLDSVLMLDTPVGGIDWLTGYCAMIDCVRHRVTFCTLEGDRFHFVGDRDYSFVPSSNDVRKQRELNFLFSACLIDEGSVVSVVLPSVVCDFLNIFPEDLTELPPHQEIKFSIDL
ncbi:uncharacterized protein LOC130786380 [Actinidia eriantha]|uniref:uncharacterized protein LOC130786380 n=1 Tax=Actinidia eriantha TaxID=165200 RepID=UPI00258EC638|nr:uncharacterized protein LOC130786380 [Actinidia eriantha]